MPLKRLATLFNQRSNLRQAVGILFVTVLISNVLGLLRNVIIANRVGVTYGSIGPLDSYYAAFALPDLLYSIVIVGALSSAILPLLVSFDAEGDDEGFWRTFNILLSTGFTVIVIGIIILYFLLPKLIPMYLPGFSAADLDLTLQLSKVLLLSPLLFTISQLSTSALQAKKIFFAPAVAPIVYNLAIITTALMIPNFGINILIAGIVVGAAGHFLIQLPSLIKLGWKFQFIIDFKNPHLKKVLKLMIPRTIALTSTQILLLAFYWLASNFKSGSIAIYRLNDDLQTAPVLLLANTLAMAVFPDFARHVVQQRNDELQRLIGQVIRFLLFIFLPVTIFMLVFRGEITSLYISIGHSIAPDEVATASTTLGFFVISLFFQAVVLVLARAFFAKSDTFRPTMISVFSIGVAFLFAMLFAKSTDYGVAGLALAFSIGSTINATLLWIKIGLPFRAILKDADGNHNLAYLFISAAIALVVFMISKNLIANFGEALGMRQSIRELVELVASFILGGGFYWYISKGFNLEQCRLIAKKETFTTK